MNARAVFDACIKAVLGVSIAVNGYFLNRTLNTLTTLEASVQTLTVDNAVNKLRVDFASNRITALEARRP